MLPLKDDVPSQSIPFVTVTIITLNVVVFLYQLSLQIGGDAAAAQAGEQFVREFGAVPCRLTGTCLTDDFPPPMITIFTSMFLHGGLFHIGGNMLYLWIFGNNVEDTLGHFRFLGFYLLAGLAAALAQTLVGPRSEVPMIGASGAISGVLGAYLLLFPYATVLTLITFGFFIRFVHVPAIIVLGFWVVVQFLNGLLAYGGLMRHGAGGGVAWFAHIGGFLAGLALVFLLRPRRPVRL
ncbi:MAG TPA: rhomboid family intramembrane serine protease [Methylomirabilota bacterium]|jgi:membrane associated rhomboid family serine protease